MLDIIKNNKNLSGKVLLVEDDKVNQMVFEGMLKNLGIDFDLAENGKKGFEMWEPDKYDVIFMDVQMPVMGGLEATQHIRTAEKAEEHQMIVALTANAYPEDRKACINAGMDAFITKPVDLEELKNLLTTCLLSVESSFSQ